MNELRYNVRKVDPVCWDNFNYVADRKISTWYLLAPDNYEEMLLEILNWCEREFGPHGLDGDTARWAHSIFYGFFIRDEMDAAMFRLRWS